MKKLPLPLAAIMMAGAQSRKVVVKIIQASFYGPQGLCIDKEGNLYVTTSNYNTTTGNKVRKITFR